MFLCNGNMKIILVCSFTYLFSFWLSFCIAAACRIADSSDRAISNTFYRVSNASSLSNHCCLPSWFTPQTHLSRRIFFQGISILANTAINTCEYRIVNNSLNFQFYQYITHSYPDLYTFWTYFWPLSGYKDIAAAPWKVFKLHWG